jgi:mannose-6-phosphate isomerase
VIYSPAGTVHAIGAGLTILEIQQNVDLTYRLYDYGRPRELHLEDGIAVSNPVPFEIAPLERDWGDGLHWTIEGPRIWMDCYKGREVKQGSASSDQWVWFVPLKGSGKVDGQCFHAGECWMLTGDFWITDAGNAEYILAHAVPA